MIYVITHKNFKKVITDNFYRTLLVGADWNSADGCDEKDNTGDNISLKNSSYCELTGLYWIWKNTCDDIVGVCHYRRYFADSFIPDKKKLLSGEDVKRYMKDFDIILPHKRLFDGKNALEFYGKYHNIEDWQRMVEVVGHLYPEYMPDIEWFEKEKKGYCYNMFIQPEKICISTASGCSRYYLNLRKIQIQQHTRNITREYMVFFLKEC